MNLSDAPKAPPENAPRAEKPNLHGRAGVTVKLVREFFRAWAPKVEVSESGGTVIVTATMEGREPLVFQFAPDEYVVHGLRGTAKDAILETLTLRLRQAPVEKLSDR